MEKIDPYADDPFFKVIPDADWNACIGRQGGEANYLEGYIEAAIELVDAIIGKKLFSQRDTLVLPILYNARHGIELALKFAADRLVALGVVNGNEYKRNHNIKALWKLLDASAVGDEKLSQTIVALKPFIDSLSRIDADGQELRYHLNSDGGSSLADYAVANLRLIQSSLSTLKGIVEDLIFRTISFVDERTTGSYTSRCSRADLLTIAEIMPSRDLWTSEEFDEKKKVVQERYLLGSCQFSKALDIIQKNREMRSLLQMESDLLHLADDDVIRTARHWRRLHPVQQKDEPDIGLDYFKISPLETEAKDIEILHEIIIAIETELSPEALAELETMFYFGRDRLYTECYEGQVKQKCKEHEVANNPHEEIRHLMEKTNFLQCVQRAAVKLGRLSLAKRLQEM